MPDRSVTLQPAVGALILAFNEARADETSMIPFGAYSPECVEEEFCELRLLGILGSWPRIHREFIGSC
jgi:hypothetical protein